jgi:hypothetical protein
MCTHVWVARCWVAAERTVATRNWPGLPRPFACWSATRPLIFTWRVEQSSIEVRKILLILYNFSRRYVRPQKRSIRSHFQRPYISQEFLLSISLISCMALNSEHTFIIRSRQSTACQHAYALDVGVLEMSSFVINWLFLDGNHLGCRRWRWLSLFW